MHRCLHGDVKAPTALVSYPNNLTLVINELYIQLSCIGTTYPYHCYEKIMMTNYILLGQDIVVTLL